MRNVLRHSLFSIFALLILFATAPVYSATYTIHLVSILPEKAPPTQGCIYFADLVNKLSHGDIDVEVSSRGKFGSQKFSQVDVGKAVALGTIEMGLPGSSVMTNFVDPEKVFFLPFLFKSTGQSDRVLDGSIGEKILKAGTSNGVFGLSYFEGGVRIIPTTHFEIHHPQDLKGLKIRTLEDAVQQTIYRNWGADPVPASLPKVVPLAQKGYIDGEDQSWSVFWDGDHYKVFHVVNETNHMRNPMMLIINWSYWQKLPQADQEILKTAAMKAALYERKLFRDHDMQVMKLCKENGIKLVKLTPKEEHEFFNSSQAVYKQFASDASLIRQIKNTP